jgi:AcrR family transcriptional regulator
VPNSSPPVAGRRTRRLPADERRRTVLDAARRVFAQRGYDGSGTAEIAAACGCSEPIIYRHFPSKQALFAAVLVDSGQLLRERIEPIFAESEDPLTALIAVADLAARDEVFIEISRLRMLAVTLVAEPEIQQALSQTVAEMHERLTGLMTRARQDGSLRADVDPAEAAWLWYGVTLQVGVRGTLFGHDGHGDARPTATALIDLLTQKENRP